MRLVYGRVTTMCGQYTEQDVSGSCWRHDRSCWYVRDAKAVGGAKIGRSAAGPLQDQELLLQEETLSENGPGSASSQENGQSGQQVPQQYNRVFHRQAACSVLDLAAREPDPR